MPIECRQSPTGGKGNQGLFYDRNPNVVAAGLPTAQQNENVGDHLKHYLLKDEADSLISDAIVPTPKSRPLPPLRKPIPLDLRYAGPFGQVSLVVNPPTKTKFETLVEDFKETMYKSYWKTPVGKGQDAAPMLPAGFDAVGHTFGKPTAFHGRLYDIVMPKVPYPDKTPLSKEAGVQKDYKYCAPPYNPNVTYGHRTLVDKRGTYAKCCLTDDTVVIGKGKKGIVNSIQSDLTNAKQPRLGSVLAPNDNASNVPTGYAFGILQPPDNLPQCLTYCEINPGVEFFRKCLKHLNTLRRVLFTRYLPTFFYKFYLTLKYEDKEKTNWLPKEIIYKHCGIKLIRFDPSLVEPLLSMWQAFDGSNIKYKTFVRVINYRELFPDMPKVPDVEQNCLEYRTTYREMVKPGQLADNRAMAGLPSGRYFDLDYPITPERCTAADRICLSHESDLRSCISPSVFTRLFVDHRDMYGKQNSANVRRVFEAAGEKFSDESFNAIWKEAQKLHSQGWVCYETFRRTLESQSNPKEHNTNNEIE